MDLLPAVAMIDCHVARHWAAGDGGGARFVIKMASTFSRLVILAIGFSLFRNCKLRVRVKARFWCQRIIYSWLPAADPCGSAAGFRLRIHDLSKKSQWRRLRGIATGI